MSRKFLGAVLVSMAVVTAIGAGAINGSVSAAGNGAPSGPHFNLNLVGVPKGKKVDMTGSNRRTMFVLADANNLRINLCQSGASNCAPQGGFQVLDGNATDSNGGLFALPSPDPVPGDGINGCPIGSTCTTKFSVYMRILGRPGGSISLTSCFEDSTGQYCSVGSGEIVTQTRSTGKSTFENVSRQLLTVCIDTDLSGTCDTREYLFGRSGANYYWEYDTAGFKLAQLRFYEEEYSFTS